MPTPAAPGLPDLPAPPECCICCWVWQATFICGEPGFWSPDSGTPGDLVGSFDGACPNTTDEWYNAFPSETECVYQYEIQGTCEVEPTAPDVPLDDPGDCCGFYCYELYESTWDCDLEEWGPVTSSGIRCDVFTDGSSGNNWYQNLISGQECIAYYESTDYSLCDDTDNCDSSYPAPVPPTPDITVSSACCDPTCEDCVEQPQPSCTWVDAPGGSVVIPFDLNPPCAADWRIDDPVPTVNTMLVEVGYFAIPGQYNIFVAISQFSGSSTYLLVGAPISCVGGVITGGPVVVPLQSGTYSPSGITISFP